MIDLFLYEFDNIKIRKGKYLKMVCSTLTKLSLDYQVFTILGITPASTQQIFTGTGSGVAGEPERWLQKKYIPLVSCIVNRIEQILNTSHLLTGTLWDRLLEFSLAVGFAVLSIPPQIESSAITTSRPFSQVGLHLYLYKFVSPFIGWMFRLITAFWVILNSEKD